VRGDRCKVRKHMPIPINCQVSIPIGVGPTPPMGCRAFERLFPSANRNRLLPIRHQSYRSRANTLCGDLRRPLPARKPHRFGDKQVRSDRRQRCHLRRRYLHPDERGYPVLFIVQRIVCRTCVYLYVKISLFCVGEE
jgi:hypothetical protein